MTGTFEAIAREAASKIRIWDTKAQLDSASTIILAAIEEATEHLYKLLDDLGARNWGLTPAAPSYAEDKQRSEPKPLERCSTNPYYEAHNEQPPATDERYNSKREEIRQSLKPALKAIKDSKNMNEQPPADAYKIYAQELRLCLSELREALAKVKEGK